MDPAGVFATTFPKDQALVRTRPQAVCLALFIALLFALPFLADIRAVAVMTSMFITGIVVIGLQINTGIAGQVNLGQAAFMGVGAYTTALLASKLSLPFWLALPLGGGAAALFGLIFGLTAVRIKGFYLALTTIAAQILFHFLVLSDSFNELKLMPSIICEGEWKNSPLDTRRTILGFINAIPSNKWWSVASFVQAIKQTQPDFQRPAGDYDSWFIKRASDGQYLRGFDSWNEVDGAFIRYFINILHWLGRLDLAVAEGAMEATAFRIGSKVESQKSDFRLWTFDEKGRIGVASNGKISIPRDVPRVIRYQISRFCALIPAS